jgi:hypothetical protein
MTCKSFLKNRDSLAREYFRKFNKSIFESKLDDEMEIRWSKLLQKTAGRAHLTKIGGVRKAWIELSLKVLDRDGNFFLPLMFSGLKLG